MSGRTRLLLLVAVVAVLLAGGAALAYRWSRPCHGAEHCIIDK